MTTQTYRRAPHSVSLLHAHLVFVTKYRRPVFTGETLIFCENTMRTVCADLDAELVEFNGETDHVHPLVAYPPALLFRR
jgi:putative transposase